MKYVFNPFTATFDSVNTPEEPSYLDSFYVENMEGLYGTSDFATGNDAIFLGGGTLQGTLEVYEVAPISGTKSLKYTQAAGSLNDYFASELIEIDPKQQNNTSGMTLYFTYDGNDNDMKFVVWDVTNGVELSNEVSFVKLASSATRYSLSFYVPASCTQIRWGAQVLVENIGAELVVDDVEMSTNPFVSADISNITPWENKGEAIVKATITNPTKASSNITYNHTKVRRVGDFWEVEIQYAQNGTAGLAGSGDYLFELPAGLEFSDEYAKFTGVVSATWMREPTFESNVWVNSAGTYPGLITALPYNSKQFRLRGSYLSVASGSLVGDVFIGSGTFASFDETLFAYNIHLRFKGKGLSSSTSHILTPSDTFSTDTAPLTYASSAQYNLTTLANAPIGTYITFTYAASTNTRTQTTTRPTQTDADMNQNGMQVFTRAYNAASTAGNPAAIAIQIGKGMKGCNLDFFKNASVPRIAGVLDTVLPSATMERGAVFKEYEEDTGIVIFDLGYNTNLAVVDKHILFSDISTATSGYLTINAGKTLPLLAVPVPQVAYLKDVKPSGTDGGTFTAGAWQTRTLNTVEGDSSIVSLNANQFTLPVGKYEIEAESVAYQVGNHKAKLYNVTTASDAIIGSSETSNTTTPTTSRSKVIGVINLTTSQVFELRHQCQTTRATDGFGVASTFAVSEVFSLLEIRKLS